MGGPMLVAELQPGDILVTIIDPRVSIHSAVSFFSDSPFVHATLYEGNGMEFSSDLSGFQRRKVGDRFLMVLRPSDLPDDARILLGQAAVREAVKLVGTPYAVLKVLVLGLEAISRLQLSEPHLQSRYCSEIVAECFVNAGHDVVPGVEDGDTTPAILAISKGLQMIGYINNV